jgi:hypothetical protein
MDAGQVVTNAGDVAVEAAKRGDHHHQHADGDHPGEVSPPSRTDSAAVRVKTGSQRARVPGVELVADDLCPGRIIGIETR